MDKLIKNKMNKIKISIIVLAIFAVAGTVNALASQISFSPSNIDKNQYSNFTTSLVINPNGSKVCAVEGEFVFNNITATSITLPSNVIPQSLPTVSNPKFLIGIPNCTTSNLNIADIGLNVSGLGSATVSVKNLDIVGEGNTLGNTQSVAVFNVLASATVDKVYKNTNTVNTVENASSKKDIKKIEIDAFKTTATSTATSTQNASVFNSTNAKKVLPYVIWIAIVIISGSIGYFIAKKNTVK